MGPPRPLFSEPGDTRCFSTSHARSQAVSLARYAAAHPRALLAAVLLGALIACSGRALLEGHSISMRSARGSARGSGQQHRRMAMRVDGGVAAKSMSAGAVTLAAAAEADDAPAEAASVVSAEAAEAEAAIAAAVNSSAGVHGWVQKQGPTDPVLWLPDHRAPRQERLTAWLEQRQSALAAGTPPPPLPLFMGCQVFVNHLYRVIYVRHAKTASSSLFCHFGGCRDTAEPGEQAALARLKFEPLLVTSQEELQSMWADYLVVTFVRNPWQRAVSAYRMMARQLARTGAPAAALSWPAFAADPAGFADTCMADAFCSKKGRSFVYVHIQPQAQCLVTAGGGGWAVDYVGRVEHIDDDLREVLAELEKRRPAGAPPVRPLEGSLENVNGRGCNETAAGRGPFSVAREQLCSPPEWYTGQYASSFAAVARAYEADVQGLKLGSWTR